MTLRLPFGWRRVTDGAVRLPIVMTFVVAMFTATMGLVWFGYVATREWRSGTNLLLERRATEALALVRAALSADMKGAWLTTIVPFNSTDLDEDPPYSMFQVAARTFARFPYPESFLLWKDTGQNDGTTCGTTRNLLDFIDATVDAQGRVLVGYADGCVGTCVGGGANTYAAEARIARQTSGKGVYAAFD